MGVPQQALAPLQHGGKSTVALAPQVKGVRRELCRRLGVRYQDLTAAGREAVDLYARARAKLAAIDKWLEKHPMLDERGQPAPCLALYSTLLNTSGRLLAQVLSVLQEMAAVDDRYDKAVQSLIAEGRKTRAGRADATPPVELAAGFEDSFVVEGEAHEVAGAAAEGRQEGGDA